MSISMEKTISHALLVPMGNGTDLSGPNDVGCIYGLPLYFVGAPGIGKSGRVKTGAHLANLPAEVVMPSHHLPEDFSGVPVMGPAGELTIECILGGVRRLMKDGNDRGLFFIDELNWARPAVQGALLRAVHERQIGDTVLPPGIRIMLAGNPPDVAGGGWELIPPLANRMSHILAPPPSPDEWTDWLLGRGGHDLVALDHGEDLVKLYWDEVWAKARGVMAGFMKHRGSDNLYKLPPEGHASRGAAWPSPRTWEMATRALATCLALDGSKTKIESAVEMGEDEEADEEEEGTTPNRDKKKKKSKKQRKAIQTTAANLLAHHFVEACVGRAAAAEWVVWLAEADLPDPEDVLDHGWKIDTQRIDRTVAVVSATTAYTLSRKDEGERVHRATQLWQFLDRVCDTQFRDLVVPTAEQLNQTNPRLNDTYTAAPGLVQIAAKVMLRIGRSGMA